MTAAGMIQGVECASVKGGGQPAAMQTCSLYEQEIQMSRLTMIVLPAPTATTFRGLRIDTLRRVCVVPLVRETHGAGGARAPCSIKVMNDRPATLNRGFSQFNSSRW